MPGPRRRPLVLVAHADPTTRVALQGPLADAGLEVVEVDSVAACIEHAVAVVPDLILVTADGEIDPSKMLTAIHADQHLLETPVVLLTTRADTLAVIEGLAAGAHDLLVLPASEAEIVSRAEAALMVRKLQSEVRDRTEDLTTLSRLDEITGLATRRHTEDHLQMVGSSARRQGRRLSMVLIDIDHLRRVNTDLTREAGDAVLKEAARRLNSCLRTDDLAGRWGGEEFLLLLPATELGGAWTLADRVRRLIADTPISVPGGEALVTMSAGCADGDGADLEDQLRRAESALDAAKASGRNRVMTDPTATS